MNREIFKFITLTFGTYSSIILRELGGVESLSMLLMDIYQESFQIRASDAILNYKKSDMGDFWRLIGILFGIYQAMISEYFSDVK